MCVRHFERAQANAERESVSEKGSKGVRLCVCVSVYAVAAVFALLLPTSQSLSQSARSKIDVVCF